MRIIPMFHYRRRRLLQAACILLGLICLGSTAHSQSIIPSIIAPMSKSDAEDESGNRGFANKGSTLQILPASGKGDLQRLYGSRALNGLQSALISLPTDSLSTRAKSIYVELISIIPKSSVARFSLGTQLDISNLQDSTATQRDVAFQKLLNSGGNISLSISRPLVYTEPYDGGFILLHPSITLFADIPALNEAAYNPGAGMRFNVDFDFRISSVDSGNVLRFGGAVRTLYSTFNSKYRTENEIDELYNNTWVVSGGLYLGILFFDLRFSFNYSNKAEIFKDRNAMFSFSVIPVNLSL